MTCHHKHFGGNLSGHEGVENGVVLLCRSEEIKGIPEICFGAYVESQVDLNCCFQKIDIRLVELLEIYFSLH